MLNPCSVPVFAVGVYIRIAMVFPRSRRPAGYAVVVLVAAAFLGIGAIGVSRYVGNYWLYRGFSQPVDPAYVHVHGTAETIEVASPALGGRTQPVDVYLPPGYATHPDKRYPVLYLLHGVPGRPGAFLDTVRMGVVEDELVATRPGTEPIILVMPYGSTGSFTDKEWANGIGTGQNWETFVSRDVVNAIDRSFRAIDKPWARGIGGLSEGGYGALNIAIHHPNEFGLVESWSGYERADDIRSIFGGRRSLLTANSPMLTLTPNAATLRANHVFFWLYTGSTDDFLEQNVDFASLLTQDRVPHRFYVTDGGHNWALWRGNAANAYIAASNHLRPDA